MLILFCLLESWIEPYCEPYWTKKSMTLKDIMYHENAPTPNKIPLTFMIVFCLGQFVFLVGFQKY